MNGCFPCENFKPIWKELKKSIARNGNKYNGITVTTNEYEYNEIQKNKKIKLNDKDITGFPTIGFKIKLNNNVSEREYKLTRSHDDIITKIENITKKMDKLKNKL